MRTIVAPSLPDAGLAVQLDVVGDLAVLTVAGEIDLFTAPALGAVVDEAIDRGCTSMVWNLAGVTFMDAAGLRVVASTSRRIGRFGSGLTIRCPSPQLRRILDLTGLAAAVRLDLPGDSPAVGAAIAS